MIVAGADHAHLRAAGSRGGELALRVCSALVLVPLAIGTAYVGGWPFAVFWGLAGDRRALGMDLAGGQIRPAGRAA